MYSLHSPSVTVNCVDCYRYNHCKLCTKFFVRFMPQIKRRFTDYHRFHRSISVKSIFVVRSHNKDATRKFAIATMRRNFATNFHGVDGAFWKSGRCLTGIVSEPTKFERIHQLPRYTSVSSSVSIWLSSSLASLSISRVTSSERPKAIIVFLNHVSRINRSWMFSYCFLRHLFWRWLVVWYFLQPGAFPYLWPCGRPFLM